MKRKQIYLEEDLDQKLKSTAIAEGRSAAAIIREAVRAYLTRPADSTSEDPFLRLAGKFTGGRSDASIDHDRLLYREAR